MNPKQHIKLPFPANISTLESYYGIVFEPGSRIGVASRYVIIMQCDHMFILNKGDTIELAT